MVRHRGVGMNKPKKKKVVLPVPVPVADEEPAKPKEPCPPPAVEPAPEPEPLDPTNMDRADWPECEQRMYDERASAALHEFYLVNKRYRKTVLTYGNGENAQLRWAHGSVYQRVLDRLQAADDENAKAKRAYIRCHREAVLFNTFVKLHQAWQKRPNNKALERFAKRALAKREAHMLRTTFAPWLDLELPTRPKDPEGVLDTICAVYGPVEAYRWVHIDQFK